MINEEVNLMLHKQRIKETLIAEFNASVNERVDRYLEIGHQWIIGNHHFAAASSECINLYRDGHFIAAVMVSHAINEGIIVFVADRVKLPRNKSGGGAKSIEDLIADLEQNGTISKTCADASRSIYESYRNDVHHMNPKVGSIDFPVLARENLKRLAIIESEIFGVDIVEGKLNPHHPVFWDLNSDGTVSVFLRLE